MLSEDLISGAKGAAQFTGLSERQIYHMVNTDLLPVIRKGKRLYFRKSHLEKAFGPDAA